MDVQIIDTFHPAWIEVLESIRHDVYHLPEYVRLEAKRLEAIPKAAIISAGNCVLFMPYLLRKLYDNSPSKKTQISELYNGYFDITSPYGYSGILLNKSAREDASFTSEAIELLVKILKKQKICSAFLRLHPILSRSLSHNLSQDYVVHNGETISVDLTLSHAEIWSHTKSSHRNKINRCKRRGFRAKIVPLGDYIDVFMPIYKETMDRVGASSHYYFNRIYFHELSQMNDHTHLCIVEKEGQVACSGIFTESCRIVQYHLGGTKTEFLAEAPSKLMFDYVRFWAKERENEVLHLGGGLGGSRVDNLHRFKAGFSRQRHSFSTLRLILDKERYQTLVNLRAKALGVVADELLDSNYFPAYRASLLSK